MDKIIADIFAVDKERLLEPFIEDNLRDFRAGRWLRADLCPLSDEWVKANCCLGGLAADAEEELLRLAAKVREDVVMKFLFYHCAQLLFYLKALYPKKVADWPDFTPLLHGERGELFLLLLDLHAIDRVVAVHRSMGIPERITRATCQDVNSRVAISREFNNGAIGVSNTCINWMSANFVKGALFQIGRMQFHLIQPLSPFRVYRNNSSGEYKIVAEPGLRVDADGHVSGAGMVLSADSYETDITIDAGNMITAYQVDDRKGVIMPEPVKFSGDEWQMLFNGESLMMNIHIPRGPRITPEIWLDSIAEAFDFFENIYPPGVKVSVACCFSWMFEPRLQQILPENSGLIRLQRLGHLFPLRTTATKCGLYFIFGKHDIDLDSAPADTSLRRGVLEHLKRGGILTGGSVLFFRDEVEKKRGLPDK